METVIVPFRLLDMDCCRFRLRWIEADVPQFCPRCGTGYAAQAPPAVLTEDLQAELSYSGEGTED